MTFIAWLKKYIPPGQKNKVREKARLDPKKITRRKKTGRKPRVMPSIYVSMAISLEFGHDYKQVVTEGIKAAARLT
jgi:hypothetical protein